MNFSWPRFRRLLANDLLQQWKRTWIATLALAGVGLVAYLTNVDPGTETAPVVFMGLFPAVLILGGLILTSTIFADLHHPLQRFHYLTLPVSNLERFCSRYLLSGPLYCLYVMVAYVVFDWLAGAIAQATMGNRAAPFSLSDPRVTQLVLTYLGVHSVAFLGAIYFRSHQLVKSLLAFVLIGCALVVVQLAAVRVVFWEYFRGFMPVDTGDTAPMFFVPPLVMGAIALALALWVLFIAYQCLREHEVQREL
jgi:hypothetical protein